MPVPYTFANIPNGQTIPLAYLDANFSYIENQIGGGTGALAITGGGTGATTAAGAMINLLPSQTGNSGKVLSTDGNGNLSWIANGGGGGGAVNSVTSNVAGLSFSPSTGTVVLAGVLSLSAGGTGATTQAGAANAILPSQSGQSGKFLITDGSNVSWSTGGTPGSGTVTSVGLTSSLSGISVGGSPITTAGTLTLSGTLGIANGGTGLTGTPLNGQLLIGNGSGFVLSQLTAGANINITAGAGTITISATGGGGSGVNSLSFGSTGLTPGIPTGGDIVVTGTLAISNGGTGQTSATAALNALLPSQSGSGGKFLTTDGTNASWGAGGGGVTPGNYGAITVNSSTPGPTSWLINNNVVTPTMLTSGAPTWTAGGNVTVNGGLTVTGSFSPASISTNTITTTGNISCAGNLSATQVSSGTGSIIAGNGAFQCGNSNSVLALLSTYYGISVGTATNTVLYQLANGDMTITGSNAYKVGGGSWAASSDSRVKKNVAPYTKSIVELLTLSPITYQYNGQYGTKDNGKTYVGFIAQDLQTSSFPDMVGSQDYTDPETEEVTPILTVDTSELVYALLNTVKQLDARIKALEGK